MSSEKEKTSPKHSTVRNRAKNELTEACERLNQSDLTQIKGLSTFQYKSGTSSIPFIGRDEDPFVRAQCRDAYPAAGEKAYYGIQSEIKEGEVSYRSDLYFYHSRESEWLHHKSMQQSNVNKAIILLENMIVRDDHGPESTQVSIGYNNGQLTLWPRTSGEQTLQKVDQATIDTDKRTYKLKLSDGRVGYFQRNSETKRCELVAFE